MSLKFIACGCKLWFKFAKHSANTYSFYVFVMVSYSTIIFHIRKLLLENELLKESKLWLSTIFNSSRSKLIQICGDEAATSQLVILESSNTQQRIKHLQRPTHLILKVMPRRCCVSPSVSCVSLLTAQLQPKYSVNTLTCYSCVRSTSSFFSPPRIACVPSCTLSMCSCLHGYVTNKFGKWSWLKITNSLYGFVFSWIYPSLLMYGCPRAVTGTKGNEDGSQQPEVWGRTRQLLLADALVFEFKLLGSYSLRPCRCF